MTVEVEWLYNFQIFAGVIKTSFRSCNINWSRDLVDDGQLADDAPHQLVKGYHWCLILRFRAAWIYYEGNCAKGFDYQKYNITELEFIEKPFVIKCVAGSGRTIFSIGLVCYLFTKIVRYSFHHVVVLCSISIPPKNIRKPEIFKEYRNWT